MNDLDTRLTAALNADTAPARDAKFRIEVLLRIERARFKRRVVLTLAVAFAAVTLVALNAQAIEAFIAKDIWRLAIVALGCGLAVLSLSGVPIEAVPGVRAFVRAVGRWLYP